jgi:hypothetical protein
MFHVYGDQLLDRKKEQGYRQYHLKDDINQATAFMALSFFPAFLSPINKMNYFRDGTGNYSFMGTVVIFFISATLVGAFIYAMRSFRSVKSIDVILFLHMMIFGTVLAANQYFRPSDYVGTVYILFILHNMFLMPVPLRIQIVPTVLYVCAMIWIIVRFRDPTYSSESTNAIITICTCMIAGYFCSRFLGRIQRSRYLHFVRERDTRAELEESLATIKQLSGILPICSHCFNIRDEEDNWHRVEAYVQNRTDARFTHTICPKCHTAHYSDEGE